MRQFHFQTEGGGLKPQHDDCQVVDLSSARSMAVTFAGDVLRETGGAIYDEDLRLTITDADGALCWDIRVIAVEGPGAV